MTVAVMPVYVHKLMVKLVCSGSFKCLWAMTMTLDPFLSSRRKCQTGDTLLLFHRNADYSSISTCELK